MKQKKGNNKPIQPTPKQTNVFSYLPIINGATLIALFCLCFLLYKNISYPLLFNDESETIMTGQQILKYGYPKAHDEKNKIFIPDNPQWLGYKKSADANISIPWGSYYFATIGVLLARCSSDIYAKTALIRIPFATAGLLGILIFVFSFANFFESKKQYKIFLLLFLFFEITSVNLFLHLREARYYSLVVLTSSFYFYLFIQKYTAKKISNREYAALMTTILFLSYNVNFITYVVMCASLVVYEFFSFVNSYIIAVNQKFKPRLKESFFNLLPVIISTILVMPLLVFFETFEIANKASEYYKYSSDLFWKHLQDIFLALYKHELLITFLIIKAILIIFYFLYRRNNIRRDVFETNMELVSFFMSIFFILYIILVARLPFIWMRYFVVLQPIMMLIMLLDIFLLFEYFKSTHILIRYKPALLICMILFVLIGFSKKESNISNYLYQLSHQYKGPLDEYIPFIKNKYSKTDTLVIATNYEELSYMYYLDCKVVLGYNYGFRTLTEDSLKTYKPDILIFRKKWGQDPGAYNYYLQHDKYERTSFSTVDWPVNNIADLEFFVKHQFKSLTTNDEKEKADMYIKATTL